MKKFKSGQIAKVSGQYAKRDARGKAKGEVTVVRGEHFPPTPKKRGAYTLADATKHKKKK